MAPNSVTLVPLQREVARWLPKRMQVGRAIGGQPREASPTPDRKPIGMTARAHRQETILASVGEPDWLLGRLTDEQSSITLSDGSGTATVAFSTTDAAMANILSLDSPARLLLLVPRTAPGMLLPLATLALFSSRIGTDVRAPAGLRSIPVRPDRGVLYASSTRRLRDSFSRSALKLGAYHQSLTGLPIFRLRADWALAAITPPTYVTLRSLPRLVFYHYAAPSRRAPNIGVDLLLAELQESDGIAEIQRLAEMIDEMRPTRAVAVTNEMNEQTIRLLRERVGFLPVPVTRLDVSLLGTPPSPPRLSFAEPFQRSAEQIKVDWSILDGKAGDALDDAHQILVDIDRALGPSKPTSVQLAWRYFNALAMLPLPPDVYESFVRSRNPYFCLKPLFARLERAFFDGLTDAERATIAPRWPGLLARLREAESALQFENPKWNRLLDAVTHPHSSGGPVALTGQLMLDAVLQKLLLGYGWTTGSGDLSLTTIRDLSRLDSISGQVLHLSLPTRRNRSLFWATSRPSTTIAAYPFEARFGYVELHRELELRRLRNQAAWRVARDRYASAASPDWPDSDRHFELAEPPVMPTRGRDRSRFEELVLALTEAPLDDDGFAEGLSDATEPLSVSSVSVLTRGGTWMQIPRDREICVVRLNAEAAELVFADTIQVGDRLALLGSDTAADLFSEALRRTQHLTGVDLRPIEHWRVAIGGLREECRGSSVGLMVGLIEAAGCRRDPLTIRLWLSGVTMAPLEQEDLRIVLGVARDGKAAEWAPVILKEFRRLRAFHRALGRRIRSRFADLTRHEAAGDRLDMEIDELLDQVSLLEVLEVRGHDD